VDKFILSELLKRNAFFFLALGSWCRTS